MDHSGYSARRNALLRRIPADTYDTPTITSSSPAGWSPAGGETITLTGTGFRKRVGNSYVTSVFSALFGQSSVAGSNITVTSDTTMTVVTPATPGTLLWIRSLGGDAVFEAAAVASNAIDAETGDNLVTEAGDTLVWE